MMDHDDMKSSLLQDLIEKIMEMKDGSNSSAGAPVHGQMADMADEDSDGKSDSADPKAAILAMDIKKDPSADEPPEMPSEDDSDMKKPLSALDIMAMKKKQMGL